MTGSYIDLDRIKELSGSKVHLTANQIVIRDRILDKCNDRGKYQLRDMKLIQKNRKRYILSVFLILL